MRWVLSLGAGHLVPASMAWWFGLSANSKADSGSWSAGVFFVFITFVFRLLFDRLFGCRYIRAAGHGKIAG